MTGTGVHSVKDGPIHVNQADLSDGGQIRVRDDTCYLILSLSNEVRKEDAETILYEQSEAAIVRAPPPDGGWGWVVVFASFMVSFIGIGITPLGQTLPYLIFCAFLFGSSGGIYVGLISVLLVDFLGLEQLTDSFGIVLLCEGIGTLIGPPIVGLLFDTYQHYLYSFLFAGLSVTISGAILLLIPFIQKYRPQPPC